MATVHISLILRFLDVIKPSVREVESLNPRLTKSDTALQTVLYRFNVYASSCVTLALYVVEI